MVFKPGVSGNPSGRPKSRPFKEALDKIIKSGDVKLLETAAMALVGRAHMGDVAAIKELADRLDGKVPQGTILAGDEEGGPVAVELRHTYEAKI